MYVDFGKEGAVLEGNDDLMPKFYQILNDGQVNHDLAGFIRKPYRYEELGQAVRQALSSGRRRTKTRTP